MVCRIEERGKSFSGCRLRTWFTLLLAFLLSAVFALASEPALPTISSNDNRVPAGHLEAGILTLHLELRQGIWNPEASDGRAIPAYSFAEEGHALQTPGPLIRVPQGTELQVSVHNFLDVTATVHGLHQRPGKSDESIEIASGETKEVRFMAGEPGSYFYWAATSERKGVRRPGELASRPLEEGLMSGALIVDATGAETADRIFVIQIWAKQLYTPEFEGILSLNGKSWPYTERLQAQIGKLEHWRIINATPIEHPMHLHGFYFHVDAVSDGETALRFSEAERPTAVTRLVLPGHSFDMTWSPERAGNWVFHCHILDHMMGDYKAPWLYGPDGPPAADKNAQHHSGDDMSMSMGMGELVMGITVTDPNPRLVSAKVVIPPPAAERQLYVRERPTSAYLPAGPGFYLEGVSREVAGAGPPLVITRGERTAITVHNQLNEPTAIHWHGMEIESYYDGVPGWDGTPQHSTPYIPPGGSFVAYMTPPRAGTFIYHSHWNDVRQLTGGMYGALLVLEPGQKYDPATDKVFVLGRSGLNEMHDPLVLNGSPQPGLMVLLTGQTYRLRLVNITPNDRLVSTSLTTDSVPVKWRAIAKDGASLPPVQATVQDAAQVISVGETYDFEFAPPGPGDYKLRFSSNFGSEVTQWITVVPPASPFSVFAAKR